MAGLRDDELVRRWKDEPAPLLPLLHAFHDRDGYISDEAIRSISAGLKTPLADLFGTVTFYHHLSRKPGGLDEYRVCTGPVCALQGAQEMCDALNGVPMACPGRCDQPVPVIQNHRVLVGPNAGSLREVPTPLPDDNPGGFEECVFRHIRTPKPLGSPGVSRDPRIRRSGRSRNQDGALGGRGTGHGERAGGARRGRLPNGREMEGGGGRRPAVRRRLSATPTKGSPAASRTAP